MLDREADRCQRVLDLVSDDPGHLGPRREAVGADDVGHVLDNGHSRPFPAERERHRHETPALPGPGFNLRGAESNGGVSERATDLCHGLARKDFLQRIRVCPPAAQGRRRGVGEQDLPPLPEGDHAGRQMRQQCRQTLLFSREGLRLLLQGA